MKNYNFSIQINDNPIPTACPLCGNETNPNIGAELFLDNLVVCRECGEKNSEMLAGLLTLADVARLFTSRDCNCKDLSKYAVEFTRREDSFGELWFASQDGGVL